MQNVRMSKILLPNLSRCVLCCINDVLRYGVGGRLVSYIPCRRLGAQVAGLAAAPATDPATPSHRAFLLTRQRHQHNTFKTLSGIAMVLSYSAYLMRWRVAVVLVKRRASGASLTP
jgi:hypothetical protein